MSQHEIKTSICHWCGNRCGVEVHIRDGRLERITEDKRRPDADLIRTLVIPCHRARHAAEWYYHPDRTKFPLKRVGEKGEGKWRQISWEQALDEIAAKLKAIRDTYGAEAIATSVGTFRTDDSYRMRLFNLLGSPNSISGADGVCYAPHRMIAGAIFGWPMQRESISQESRSVMVVGTNPQQSETIRWLKILNAQKAGAKLVVVDPRRTPVAKRADLWLQLRPGTDAALLLSVINTVIEEDLYDKDFIAKWCYGFDKLRERAKEYPAEEVEKTTWVPADKILTAARLYATNKPGAVYNMMGVEQTYSSIQAIHCEQILAALTGSIDRFGGVMIGGHHDLYISDYEINLNEAMPAEQKAKQLGADRFKLTAYPGFDLVMKNMKKKLPRDHTCHAHAPTTFRAMITGKPYPVRAMITAASNPMVTCPNTKLVYKALKSLDLYVVSDYWMTPSAELADYVLPAACWLERPIMHNHCEMSESMFFAEAVMPAKVDGQWERRNDYDLWHGLAIRLGFGDYFPWETLEDAYNYRIQRFGKTLKQIVAEGGYIIVPPREKKYDALGFGTPTGKVELYSTVLEQLGYDPLPQYLEPPESPVSTPELAKEFPLILITGSRHQPFFHSEHRHISSLRKQRPYPNTQINPKTAAELGINDGDWVWIETPRGRVRQKCQLFEDIHPKVVSSEHGWWFPELPGEEPWLHGVWESNINVVTDDEPDHCNPINGGWPNKAELCKVYKATVY